MSTKSKSAASHDALNRSSLFNMKGRVALVTGRTKEKLDKVVEIYNKDIEGEIIPLQGDVTSKEDIARLYDEVSSREKCLCILINNAGVSGGTVSTESETASEMKKNLFDAEGSTFDDWTNTYKTNVAANFFVTAAFLPLLSKSAELHPHWSGTVINISSISGRVKSAQHHFSYNASKAAAAHLNRMLAAEIAENGHKIRVNSIAPGVFPSEMTEGDSDEFQKSHLDKEKYADRVPAARPGKDVDMAQGVLFLAANQYLNGQVVSIDGGYEIAAGL